MVGLPEGTLRVAVQNDDPARTGVDVVDPRTRTTRIRTEASVFAPYELAATSGGDTRREPPPPTRLDVNEEGDSPPPTSHERTVGPVAPRSRPVTVTLTDRE